MGILQAFMVRLFALFGKVKQELAEAKRRGTAGAYFHRSKSRSNERRRHSNRLRISRRVRAKHNSRKGRVA